MTDPTTDFQSAADLARLTTDQLHAEVSQARIHATYCREVSRAATAADMTVNPPRGSYRRRELALDDLSTAEADVKRLTRAWDKRLGAKRAIKALGSYLASARELDDAWTEGDATTDTTMQAAEVAARAFLAAIA